MAGSLRRRSLFAGAGGAAAALFATPVPRAFAGEEWCSDDPPVDIVTPAGNLVTVQVTNYAKGAEHASFLNAAQFSVRVKPVGSTVNGVFVATGTDVWLNVVVPIDPYGRTAVKSVVSTEPNARGTILGSDTGRSGDTLLVFFRLNTP